MKNSDMVRIGVGVAIIILGLIVLIDLFARFIDIEILIAWWPLVFVLIGFLLVSSKQSNTLWTGVALLLAGTVAVLDRMDLFDTGFRPIITSVVLVLVGVLVVTPIVTTRKRQ